MSVLPMVFAPHDSGVTQEQLNDALVSLVELRTLELLTQAAADADRVGETIGPLVNRRDLSDHAMTRVLNVIDVALDRTARNRLAVQYRLDALRAARANAATPMEPLTLLQSA